MRLAAEYVVKVAVMAALLTALKFALSFIPNVEVVTLLITVYAAVFGAAYVFPAVLVFCAVEVAIYGVGSWVILYFVYWPLLAALSCLILSRKRSAVAVGFPGLDLGAYWVAYYVRGLTFDLVHIASNLAVVGALFKPLVAAGERVKRASRTARGG